MIDFTTTATDEAVSVGGVCGGSNSKLIKSGCDARIRVVTAGQYTAGTARCRIAGFLGASEIGIESGNIIHECYAKTNFQVDYDNTDNCAEIGGFIGFVQDADIQDCYNNGSMFDIDAGTLTPDFKSGGGFQGVWGGGTNVINQRCLSIMSHFLGNGAILGWGFNNDAGADAASCFWDTDSSGIETVNTGATGKTTKELQTPSTYAGWNPSKWIIQEGKYPMLKSELMGASLGSDSRNRFDSPGGRFSN
jgi:hypothetical protein